MGTLRRRIYSLDVPHRPAFQSTPAFPARVTLTLPIEANSMAAGRGLREGESGGVS